MDKAEYRIRTDEIKDLIADGEYGEAAEIADEIDWRRVKSVKMLCIISDLYKINRRYEDARNILLIAYDKNPQSRKILYALCELSIRLQELVDAIEYYKAFVQAAPQDSGRFVLQYRLYQAQDVSLEERIEVLEELKKAEYTERWGYELAYLYHRAGMPEKCVKECDELILWFGEGKYVTRAMELKMLYEPLTEAQQYKYDHREMRRSQRAKRPAPEEQQMQATAPEEQPAPSEPVAGKQGQEEAASVPQMPEAGAVDVLNSPTTEIIRKKTAEPSRRRKEAEKPQPQPQESSNLPNPEEIRGKTMDGENKFSTMNLQKELAASLQELLGEVKQQTEPVPVEAPSSQEEMIPDEVILFEQESEPEPVPGMGGEGVYAVEDNAGEMDDSDVKVASRPAEKIVEIYREPVVLAPQPAAEDETQGAAEPESRPVEPVHIMEIQHPGQEDSMISMTRMEGDGQIGMILPEPETMEQQIKGQLSIEDILAEWDKKNQQAEEEHKAEIYERSKAQTGEIFAEFDAKKQEDILNELQFLADEQEERDRQEEQDRREIFDDPEVEEARRKEEKPVSEEEPQPVSIEKPSVSGEEPQLVSAEKLPVSGNGQQEDEYDLFAGLDDLLLDEPIEREEPLAGLEDEETAKASETGKPEKQKRTEISPMSPALREKAPEKYRRYIHSEEGLKQIETALKTAELPIGSGNIIVEGDNYDYCFAFIRQLLSDLKESGMALSGKLARIPAVNLNRKKTIQIMNTLEGGAMVIEHISMLNADKVQDIEDALLAGERKLLLILVDTPEAIREFASRRSAFMKSFTVRVGMQGLSAKELVQYGATYACSKEYVIDEMALLALQTRIEEEEASDKVPMPEDVERMVDAAVRHANRIGMRKFISTLSGSRYNAEDRIILKEQDFV
ncbi:MAG: hypothetical protein LUE87_08030 [Lachnospiraceae bacterium]|nr:hypothetical protein [Lachnospiraceae bacterium]